MAGEERDARLILRAEDRASRTFQQVARSVKDVRQSIAEQAKAAREGVGDIDAMKRSLEELTRSGDDLVRGQSLIRAFESQTEAADKASKRLDAATASLDAYRAKAGANPTDNQSAQIEKRAAAVGRAQQNLERAQQRLADVEQRMQRAGIATDNLETQFDQMAAAAVEAAQGIAAAKSAIDDYPDAVRRATAANEEFKASQALAGKDTSFLTPGEFEFIQSLDSAKAKLQQLTELEALEARQAATAARAETQRRQQQRAAIEDVYESSRKLEGAFATLADEQKRIDDVAAFRKVGQDAAESAVRVDRYAASVQSLGNDFQSFAGVVRTAMGGTQSSLQDIGQAIAQVDASTQALEGGKRRINELQESSGKLAIAIATLDRTARQIDGFRLMQQTVQSAEATFAEAQQEVLRLARAVGEADAPSEALARDLEQAQRALARAGTEMQRARNDAIKLADGLRRAGIDTDNLDAEMQRLTTSATRAGTASAGLQSKLRGRGGFLGLNPFELQNLGYQINDIFVSLASGQKPLTVLVQQGAQIGQLFQGFFTTLLRFAPLVGGVLVLLAPFIGALVQSARAVDELREANVRLAGSADAGVQGLAQQYAEAGVQLRNLGVGAKDTKTALDTFHSAGLNPEGLDRYVQALSDAAKGGADVEDTTKLLTEALTGGSDAVRDLNDKFNLLTPAEEAQIEKMIESGQESEARRILYEKFEETAARMADRANGPWSKAWDNLTVAFNNFTSAISNSAPFVTLGRWLDWIRDKITAAMDDIAYFLNYASKRGIGGTISDAWNAATGGNGSLTGDNANQAQREAAMFANRRGRAGRDTPFPAAAQNDTRAGARAVRDLRRELQETTDATKKLSREETVAAAKRKALLSATGSPAQRAEQARLAGEIAGTKYDEKAEKAAAAAAKKRKTADDKAKRAAETLANQRRQIAEQLERDLASIEAKVEKNSVQSLEERLGAVDKAYTGLFQKLDEFKRKGGTQIDGHTVPQYEAAVRAQIAMLRNQEQLKFYEESINTALKDRTDAIKAIEEAYDRGDISPQQATQEAEEIISRFAPKVNQLAVDALAFAQSLRTAVPDPKLEAFITRMERMQAKNTSGQDRNAAKAFDEGVIDQEARKLQQLIQQRDELVAAENTLVELGVKTRTDAQAAIEAAYARTTPLIQQQSGVLSELLGQFVKAYPEMATFYDTWMAKLAGVAAQTDYVDARYTQLKNGLDQMLSGSIVEGISLIASEFAKLGTTVFRSGQDVWKTLQNIGLGLASLFAELLIGIGKLILQMIILDAVQKVTGIPVAALLKTFSASGLHTGGVAGQERTFSRRVPEAAFLNAPRYHGGGVAGFAPDEVPAILRRNEEVLEETDPRHRFNLGKGGGGSAPAAAPVIRQALVLSPEELANAMAGASGEEMVVTHIRRNRTTIKQMLGE